MEDKKLEFGMGRLCP